MQGVKIERFNLCFLACSRGLVLIGTFIKGVLLLLLDKIFGGAHLRRHPLDSAHVLLELFVEGWRLRVVDHVLMYAVFDHDQTQQVVVDHRCLHLVQLFWVLSNSIVLCRKEEVASHKAAKHSISEEFETFVVL